MKTYCERMLTCAVLWLAFAAGASFAIELKVATFKADVTPPPGSPLCDGSVRPQPA